MAMANVISNNNPRLYHLNKQSSKQMCVAYIFDFLATKLSAGKWTMGISETLESWHLQSHDVARLFLIQGPIL